MYTPVSFGYEGNQVHEIFVAVYPTFANEVRYIIEGIAYGRSVPVTIGAAGAYEDVTSALEKVKAIHDKYPPKALGVAGPEFTGI